MSLSCLFLVAELASGAFTDINAGLTEVECCDITWGDYDNDGDLDLASAGWIKSWPCVANICRNDGGGVFFESNSGLERCMGCSLPWGDYDGDGDLDLAIAGYWYDGSNSWGTGDVFRNDGGNFAGIGAPVVPMGNTCSLAWGDYDNDGDLDLALAGSRENPFPPVSRIYRNDGGGAFVDVNAALTDVKECSLAWADYDNDGDLDLALAGDTGSGYSTTIYGNNGDGTFADIGAGLPGVNNASLAWGDYDNDGDFDLALTGYDGTSRHSKVFRNDGGGTFTDINAALTAVTSSYHGVAWGDYDNDGDLDLAILGHDGSTWLSKLYRNDGGGTFTEIAAGLANCYRGTMAWGDYDNDGDLDLIVGGKTTLNPFNPVTRLYRNDSAVSNAPPSMPTGLASSVSGSDVTFSWNAATDAETPQPGLSYNLRVGTASELDDVMSGAADTATGWRKIPATGNAQKMTSWTVKGLPDGTYYWSVQAVDTAFAGSPWAVEQTVTVGGPVVWHVDAAAPGDQSGSDWANAMRHPQDAVDLAAPGDEVWVAGGTYVRRIVTDTVVLTMWDGVAVYGGFGGWETSRDERDPVANVTTLDGEDFCYHVVVGASNATLDGVTATRGNAIGLERFGGGILNDGVIGLTVANCRFTDNNADYGGGMHNRSSSSPSVTNCTFSGNTGEYGGGMYNLSGSSPIITDCTFLGNTATATGFGGAMCNVSASPTITNCTFLYNLANQTGGGIYNSIASPAVTNCTFYGNTANSTAGAIHNKTSSLPTVRNCVLRGDWAPSWPEIYDDGGTSTVSYSDVDQVGGFADGGGNINADPLFVDEAGGDFHLSEYSPCIDSADGPAAPPLDMDGNGRYDDQGMPNVGPAPPWADMGVFEFQSDSPAITVTIPGAGSDMAVDAGIWITWQTTGTVDWVDIQLSRDGGASWEGIVAWQVNSDQYWWIVTAPASTNCIVRVSDSTDGLPSAVSGVFKISDTSNTPPTVNLSASPTTGVAPLPVTFNAGSFDADGDLLTHRWDWNNDGTWDSNTGTVSITSYTFNSPGAYIVWVRVSDGTDIVTDSITITVTDPNLPPTVSITTPSDGATVSGVVYVRASASDIDGIVDRVDFYVDGAYQATDGGAPHEYNWDSTTVSDGWHTIMARAYDNDSDWSEHTINVNVQNSGANVAPTAYDGSANTDMDVSVDCFLSYNDPDGPGPHQFSIVTWPMYGTLSGSGQNWTYTPNSGWTGTDTFDWQVYDGIDNSNVAMFQITVSDPGSNQPPNVAIDSPVSGAIVSGVVYVKADAWDNDGNVVKVEFHIDGSQQATDYTDPYEYYWTSTTVADGWHTILARAYDDDGEWEDTNLGVDVQNGDVTPPGPVMNLQITNSAETTLLLEWTNPYDPDFWNVVVLRSSSAQPDYVPYRGEDMNVGVDYGNSGCMYDGPGRDLLDGGLTANTEYYYAVYAYDYSRNYSAASYFNGWTTGFIAPWVEWTDPWNDQMNVPLNRQVRIRFSEPMDEWATENAFSISPYVDGGFWWEEHGRTLVFGPWDRLDADTWYWVTIGSGARDLVGQAMADHSFGFRTQLDEGVLGGGCGMGSGLAGLLLAFALVLRRKRA